MSALNPGLLDILGFIFCYTRIVADEKDMRDMVSSVTVITGNSLICDSAARSKWTPLLVSPGGKSPHMVTVIICREVMI